MQDLIVHQAALLNNLSSKERYLGEKINWENRLIGIKGARGAGKTTLLLQRAKFILL